MFRFLYSKISGGFSKYCLVLPLRLCLQEINCELDGRGLWQEGLNI